MMNPTTRMYFRTLVLSLVMAVIASSWTTKPAMAQTREIPGHIQIHLKNVIKFAATKGDIIRIEKMNLNSIVALLDHKDHRVVSAAAYALGEIRDVRAVPALVSALKSDRNHLRRIPPMPWERSVTGAL